MAIKIKGTPIIDDGRSIINAGISTISGVTINTGIITSSSQTGIVTYYGDASNLSKNFPLVRNILYVSKNGNDGNPGTRLSEPKATVRSALAGATAGTVIKVSAGTYIENNPLTIPTQVSVIGDSLREVSIQPLNADKDLFYVSSGNYIAEMSFTGSMNSGKAIFTFNPDQVDYFDQSPYIQNCTNFIPNSTGLNIDGKYALGPLKSMVLDSYTQYNQGGIGVSITNEGYAQLVSLFTICDDVAVYCGSGGACDLTNSNSSFGNYGLVADGVSSKKYAGIITQAAPENSDTFVLDLSTPTLGITTASYDNVTGILTVFTSTAHKFSVGMGVSIADLKFTCPFEPGIRTYPRPAEVGGKGHVFEIKTVAPGRFVDASNLILANKTEIVDKSLAAIALDHPDFFYIGDPPTHPSYRFKDSYRLIQKNRTDIVNSAWGDIATQFPEVSGINTETKCKRDLGYFVDAVSTDLFTGGNSYTIAFTKQYFNSAGVPISNGLVGEEAPSIVGFTSAGHYCKQAITNQLAEKDLSITADPNPAIGNTSNTNPTSCTNVRDAINTLVGIATLSIGAGNLNIINQTSLNGGTFLTGQAKCRRDIGYIVDAVASDVRNFTTKSIIEATKIYFDNSGNPLNIGITTSITAFQAVREYSKQAITNNLNVKDLTLPGDPTNTDPASCANVQQNINTLVGILTTFLGQGSLTTPLALPSVSTASTIFTMNVGVATQPHTYVSGGNAKINVSRPFDGQVVYFSDLYYTANKIRVSSGGSGYTSTPTVTISSPSTSWGVPATAVAEISNGSVSSIDIISNGRGYTTPPLITIGPPNVGINTATATLELTPTYYSILSSTPVSSGICTINVGENVPYAVGVGTAVPFFKQSRVLASGHSLEYIGSGTEIAKALPAQGGVTIQDNEIDSRNGGLVVFTSTDQSGNFRIGDGVVINQQTGTISGAFYSKSLFSSMTPYILALGGE
jgi:hypothetical protein